MVDRVKPWFMVHGARVYGIRARCYGVRARVYYRSYGVEPEVMIGVVGGASVYGVRASVYGVGASVYDVGARGYDRSYGWSPVSMVPLRF